MYLYCIHILPPYSLLLTVPNMLYKQANLPFIISLRTETLKLGVYWQDPKGSADAREYLYIFYLFVFIVCWLTTTFYNAACLFIAVVCIYL